MDMGADLLGSVLGEQGSDVGGWARGSRRREPVESGRVVGGHTGVMALPLALPIKPMLAKLAREIPDGDGWLYEPKWDGFRCIVFRDGDEHRAGQPQRAAVHPLLPRARWSRCEASLPERCVVDGEIVVPDGDGHGLDFDALLQRIHPAESRVRAPGRRDAGVVRRLRPAGARRRRRCWDGRSATAAPSSCACCDAERAASHLVTPASTDRGRRRPSGSRRFEGAGLDGVVAKRLDDPYQPDKRTLVKVKHQRTADCVVAGYRIHKDGNGVGSLLLGLFDDDGRAAPRRRRRRRSPSKRRAELLAELEPLTHDALDDHPWREWAR